NEIGGACRPGILAVADGVPLVGLLQSRPGLRADSRVIVAGEVASDCTDIFHGDSIGAAHGAESPPETPAFPRATMVPADPNRRCLGCSDCGPAARGIVQTNGQTTGRSRAICSGSTMGPRTASCPAGRPAGRIGSECRRCAR